MLLSCSLGNLNNYFQSSLAITGELISSKGLSLLIVGSVRLKTYCCSSPVYCAPRGATVGGKRGLPGPHLEIR